MAETKTLGIISLIFGILSIPLALGFYGPILAVAGIILAIIQNRKFKTKLATAGLVLSIIGLALFVIFLVLSFLTLNL